MKKENGYIPNNLANRIFFKILKFVFLNKKLRNKSNYKKIVLVKFGGIGDVILMTPILKPLKKEFPDAKISLIVWDNAKCIFENYEVITSKIFDTTKIRDLIRIFSFKEIFRIKGRIKNTDLVIFLNRPISIFGTLKLVLITLLSKNAEKIGLDTIKRAVYLDYKITDKGLYIKHEVEYLKDILKKLNIYVDSKDLICEIDINKKKQYKIGELIKYYNINNFITIHVGSAIENWRKLKRVDIKIWENFIEMILLSKDISIVLVGTNLEYNINEILISKFKYKKEFKYRIYNFAGKTNIYDLFELISISKLFVGNDSGVAHVASCTSTPIITLFTFSDQIGYRPWAKESFVVRNKINCSPCLYEKKYEKCEKKKCLNIDPNEIYKIAIRII